jgi:hypothetical protein
MGSSSFHSRAVVASLLCLLLITPATASDWGIVLNGKALHVDSQHDWNESNWGLGFEREFHSSARWVKVALGGGFIDSQSEMSYMGGGGLKRRFRAPALGQDVYFDLGAIGFFMTRQDINDNRAFPGILPAFTAGTRHFAINLTYLPGRFAHQMANAREVDPSLDGIFFLQFKLDASLFSPGARRIALAAAED